MLRNFILVLLCGFVSAPAFSGEAHPILEKSYYNLGFHNEFVNSIQDNGSGRLRSLYFSPVLGLGTSLPISGPLNFFPEFNWVLPKFTENSHIITNTFMYRADLAYNLISWLRLRVGTSLMHLNQHGRGGKSNQRNGTGNSSFYYPDENRSSLNNTFDLGAEALYDHFALRLQTYTYSIFKEERRQLSYTLFLTYYWEKAP